METPASPLLPSSWSAEVLAAPYLQKAHGSRLLLRPACKLRAVLPLVTSWVSGAVYLTGWSKAQESKQGRRKYAIVESALNWLTRPFPPVLRALMVKDIKTFLRDSTQWSQLFLLVALIVVYLYNFKVLPLDRSPLPTATLKTVVAFANLAGRFRIECRCHALRFSRRQPRRKGFLDPANRADLPTHIAMGQTLAQSHSVVDSRRTARVSQQPAAPGSLLMMMLSLATVFLMTFGITAICVGVGALYPKFTFDHAAEIPTSFGGAVCMIVSIAFIGAVDRSLADLPSGDARLSPGRSTVPELWVIAPSLPGVLALTLAAVITPIRLGLKSLERLKE